MDALRTAMEHVEEINGTIPEGVYLTLMNALQNAYQRNPQIRTVDPMPFFEAPPLPGPAFAENRRIEREAGRNARRRRAERADREPRQHRRTDNTRNFFGGLWLRDVTPEMLAERAERYAEQYARTVTPPMIPTTMGEFSQMAFLYEMWRIRNTPEVATMPRPGVALLAIRNLQNNRIVLESHITHIKERIIASHPDHADDLEALATRFFNRSQMNALAQHEFKKAFTEDNSFCHDQGYVSKFLENIGVADYEAPAPPAPIVAPAPAPAPAPADDSDSSDSDSDSSDSDSTATPPPVTRRRIVVRRN